MLAKISLALSVILACCTGYLFTKLKSNPASPDTPAVVAPSAFEEGKAPKSAVVAIVNGDSILAKYDFAIEFKKEYEQKFRSANAKVANEYEAMRGEYEKSVSYYQNTPNMSDAERAALEESIAGMEMQLENIKSQQEGSVMQFEAKKMNEFHSRMDKYLEKYSRDKGIDYILNYQKGMEVILHHNGAFDVTSEVLAGLNEEFRNEKQTNRK